jgi:N-acyl-D-amino-acid deacylase
LAEADVLDCVIRSGTIVDGTGQPARHGDIGIAAGRIVAIGDIDEPAVHQIDASDLVVAPGFIDGHTHLDAQVFWEPTCSDLSVHGATTAIMGNCGFSIAPGSLDHRDLVMRSLERAEDVSRDAVALGVDWTWSDYPGYLDRVDALHPGINLAGYVGHSALRAAVMGERAFEAEATADELAQMRQQLTAAVMAGAIGFSTSLSSEHRTVGGEPVASRWASWHEVEQLVDVLRGCGRGVFQLALERSTDRDEQAAFHRRLGELVIDTGVRCTFGALGSDVGMVCADTIVAAGGDAVGQVHVRAVNEVFGFQTRLPFDALSDWSDVRSRPLPEQRIMLTDPIVRQQLVRSVAAGAAASASPGTRLPDLDRLMVVGASGDPSRSVGDVARERRIEPVVALIDLALESEFAQLFSRPLTNLTDAQLLGRMRSGHSVIAGSDSGAHVSQILDSNIPTYMLSHWVREVQAFTLEEAVRLLTSRPADVWGLRDRGRVALGCAADLVVFDPAAVGFGRPRAVNDLPDGGVRLSQESTGVAMTMVNGHVVQRDGVPTEARAGVVLRTGGHRVAR